MYEPPEHEDEVIDSYKSDIFAMGMTLLSALTQIDVYSDSQYSGMSKP